MGLGESLARGFGDDPVTAPDLKQLHPADIIRHPGLDWRGRIRANILPRPLPADHPPTLFLHGDTDTVVPMPAVQPYIDALGAEGHASKLVTDPDAGHQWLAAAVAEVPAWFDAYR